MDIKLKLFLEKINLNQKYFDSFSDAKILKIKSSKDKLNWNFIIQTKDYLPVEVLKEIDKNISKGFPELKTVTYTIVPEKENNLLIDEYYSYVISNIGLSKAVLQLFVDKKISYTTDGLFIEVDNKSQENTIKNKLEDIENKYRQIGFNIKLDVLLDSKSSIGKEEIKYDGKPIEKKEEKKDDKKKGPMKSAKASKEVDAILGTNIVGKITPLNEIYSDKEDVMVEAKVFGKELFESPKTSFKIITLKLTDYTDSLYTKIFFKDKDDFDTVASKIKEGKWYRLSGNVKFDEYSRDYVLSAYNMVEIPSKDVEITDDSEEKRVELHTHSIMSQMDGVSSIEDIIKQAKKWGHRGIAVTDHDGVQAFPNAFNLVRGMNKELAEGEEPFKVIYGAELVMVDDNVDIVVRPSDEPLKDTTFVVFDLETTGFNAGGKDSIIEIGAAKIKNGEILETYDELVNPGRKLPKKIVELTHITDDMLKDKVNEEEAVKKFMEWTGNAPMVAHNAKFDTSFIAMAFKKYNLGEFKNPVIDTLELSRTMDRAEARHNLSAITKRYGVEFDEEGHHRGNYDAEATALVFHKMIKKLLDQNFKKVSDLNNLVSKDEIYKYGNTHHINILTLTREGLKNLFKIVSFANTLFVPLPISEFIFSVDFNI